jgi:hypothetical protein
MQALDLVGPMDAFSAVRLADGKARRKPGYEVLTIGFDAKPVPAESGLLLTPQFEQGPWGPGSVHVTTSGPMKADLRFDDRDGHHWQGTITVEAVPADSHQFVVRIATARAG